MLKTKVQRTPENELLPWVLRAHSFPRCHPALSKNIVLISFYSTKSSYIGKSLLTKSTISRRKGREGRIKYSDSLKNPLTHLKNIKFESIRVQSIYLFDGFVTQFGNFRPRILRFVYTQTNPVSKGTGFVTNPDDFCFILNLVSVAHLPQAFL